MSHTLSLGFHLAADELGREAPVASRAMRVDLSCIIDVLVALDRFL